MYCFHTFLRRLLWLVVGLLLAVVCELPFACTLSGGGANYGPDASAAAAMLDCHGGCMNPAVTGCTCVDEGPPGNVVRQAWNGGTDCISYTVSTSCTAGQHVSSGYFDIGTDPNSAGSNFAFYCQPNGCEAIFSGTSPAGSSLVGGPRHFYAKGSYDQDGQTCTPGSGGSGLPYTNIPASTCTSGQFVATVNGITKCFTPAGQAVAETVPAAATQTTTNSVATNPDGSKTVTTTVTNNQTNISTVTVSTYASGATVPSIPSSVTGPASSGGATDPLNGQPKGSMGDFCAQNPSASACQNVTPGSAATVGTLYTADTSGKTFSSVLTNFKTTLQGAAFYSAAANFLSAGSFGGSCSGLSTSFNMMGYRTYTVDFTPYLCGSTADGWYSLFAAGILLAATYYAFRIAIL